MQNPNEIDPIASIGLIPCYDTHLPMCIFFFFFFKYGPFIFRGHSVQEAASLTFDDLQDDQLHSAGPHENGHYIYA